MNLSYELKRSRSRRNLALKIQQGQLVVHAPWRLSERDIQRFVEQKREWIERHIERQQQQLAGLVPRQWQTGERLRWLSEPLTLVVQHASRKQIKREAHQLIATMTPRSHADHEPRTLVVNWYKQQAQQWLDDFFAQWPRHHGLNPSGWSVGDFRSKWGHCTRKGELKFTWKLWIAPEWVVRNVVIHELCHLREFNHSAKFWQLVAQHSPDYKEAEKWLRRHGMTVLSADYLDYQI